MPKDVVSEVVFDGLAVADGSMDVRDLAPALLALGDVLQEANREFNGERADLTVSLESNVRGGSIHLSVGLLLTTAQQLQSMLGPEPLTTAKQLADWVGLVTGQELSLFGLLKLLKGRKPISAVTLGNGFVQIVIQGDGNTITLPPAPPEVYNLARNQKVRDAVERTVAPVTKSGIDKLEFREGPVVVTSVEKDDVSAFQAPKLEPSQPIEPDSNPSRQAILQVIKPSFKDSLKWRFSDGSHEFGAYMKDQTFLGRVSQGKRSFTAGDKLRVEIRSTPHIDADQKLSTEYEVLRVLDEYFAPKQVALLPDPEP